MNPRALIVGILLLAGCSAINPPKGGSLSMSALGGRPQVLVEQGAAAETPTHFWHEVVTEEPAAPADPAAPQVRKTTETTQVEFGSSQDWSKIAAAASKNKKPIIIAIFALLALGAGGYLFFQGWRILGLATAGTGIAGLAFYQYPWALPIGAVICVILYLVVKAVENRYLPPPEPA